MTRKKSLYKDIVGEKYGKWTVLSFSHSVQKTETRSTPYWNCISDDGEECVKSSIALCHLRKYVPKPRVKKEQTRKRYIKLVSELTEEELEKRRAYFRRYRHTHREQLRKAYKKHYWKTRTLEQKIRKWLRM